jgi:O-antigen ligase
VVLAASLGLWTSDHPLQVRKALADLWIGAAALVGWSLALDEERQERLLRGLLWPAAALGLLGILQFHRLFQPLELAGVAYDPRLSIVSLAGNPGDLAAYLVLPALIAQWFLARGARGKARWGAAAALAVCIYAILLTQTLAALAALALGSALLWMLLLPRRLALAVFGGGGALALVLVLAVAPLRSRVLAKVEEARQGDWNAVLTGRLDGWRAAVWMFREHPWTGVGHGAYLPEFVPAKLALLDRGTTFYSQQVQPVFANAHNEVLEVAAEWGIPGLIALGWGLLTLFAALRRGARAPSAGGTGGESALAWAGTAALAVLCLAHFPFRLALVAFPALLFLGWVFRRGDSPARRAHAEEAA